MTYARWRGLKKLSVYETAGNVCLALCLVAKLKLAQLPLEKSDSLGMKTCRKRLWDYFGGMQFKTNMAEFSVESHGMDCSGDQKVLTELQIAIRSKLLF